MSSRANPGLGFSRVRHPPLPIALRATYFGYLCASRPSTRRPATSSVFAMYVPGYRFYYVFRARSWSPSYHHHQLPGTGAGALPDSCLSSRSFHRYYFSIATVTSGKFHVSRSSHRARAALQGNAGLKRLQCGWGGVPMYRPVIAWCRLASRASFSAIAACRVPFFGVSKTEVLWVNHRQILNRQSWRRILVVAEERIRKRRKKCSSTNMIT